VPNGFQRPDAEPIRCPAAPPRIGFVGPLNFFPNLEGIRWFARECWPRIKGRLPEVRLRLAGQGSDGGLKPAGADIDGLGWVENLAGEVATWSLMIIPLNLGAGTRVKLAQAFSLKCPVVSTSVGAYGYGLRNGVDAALADTPEAFAEACIRLVRQPGEAAAMAVRAWERFLTKWTWEAVTPRIWAAAESRLRVNAA
jgi:polysaccharide biosynthesis protein PslH